MDLRVKDLIVIILSLLAIFILGYAYVFTENYIFDDILSDYIPVTGVWILRIIWTATTIKLICDASKDFTLRICKDDFKNYKEPANSPVKFNTPN